ncbi:MAG: chlorite dismutase family protein [Nitrospirae bacterium]|nr:chlorite dismutase family protein [Nitrospirota bacterium]
MPQSETRNHRRQFVSFVFYRLDPAFRRLPDAERLSAKTEFLKTYGEYAKRIMIFPYSTMGTRADCDFMLWRISYRLEDFQQVTSDILATGLGRYLNTAQSYLSMTSRSIYVQEHSHEGGHASRTEIVPAQSKYLFVYPFTKTPDWYLLSFEQRQKMMDAHFQYGHKYPSVKVNTTYSFGLDDQEFVVAFETDQPGDFLDLVMEMRSTEVRRYTLKDTPIFTCVKEDIRTILSLLDGTPLD